MATVTSMKFWGLLLVVVLLFAVPAEAAQAPTLNQRVARLEARVRLLDAQAMADRSEVQALTAQNTRLEQALDKEIDRGTCQFALDRDTINSLYHTMGLMAQAVTGANPPPDFPRYDDGGACTRIGQAR